MATLFWNTITGQAEPDILPEPLTPKEESVDQELSVIPGLLLNKISHGVKKSKSVDFITTTSTHNADCITKEEHRQVRGHSLSGLVEPGATVKILFDFYRCNTVGRGDIIAYNYAGNEVPIIKIVKGIPGDIFSLEKSDKNIKWRLVINGKVVKNHQNQPYMLNKRGYRMLHLYESDFKGVIPKNTYLILGNLVSGTTDSSRFGLVHKSDILGKVVTGG